MGHGQSGTLECVPAPTRFHFPTRVGPLNAVAIQSPTRKGVGIQLHPRAPKKKAPVSHISEGEPFELLVDLSMVSVVLRAELTETEVGVLGCAEPQGRSR